MVWMSYVKNIHPLKGIWGVPVLEYYKLRCYEHVWIDYYVTMYFDFFE